MGVAKHAYPEFARALGLGHTRAAIMVTWELRRISLEDGLRLALLLRRDGDPRAETWLARWVARYVIASPGLRLSQLSELVDALMVDGVPNRYDVADVLESFGHRSTATGHLPRDLRREFQDATQSRPNYGGEPPPRARV